MVYSEKCFCFDFQAHAFMSARHYLTKTKRRQNKICNYFHHRQQSNDYALGNKAIRTMLSRKAIEDDFHHPRMLLMLQQ